MTLRAVAPGAGGAGGGVETVTGTMVDNTDPQNPVINSDPTKLTTVSTPNIVYRTSGSGAQSTITLSTAATASTLPFRSAAGQFNVGTPVTADNVATKGYVDGLV